MVGELLGKAKGELCLYGNGVFGEALSSARQDVHKY